MDISSYLLGKKNSGGGSGGLDWTALGFESQPDSIQEGYDYALYIKNNFNGSPLQNDYNLVFMPTVTLSGRSSYSGFFQNCYSLLEVAPLNVQLSSKASFYGMFNYCYSLKRVALFDLSMANNVSSIFSNCYCLEDIPQFNISNATNLNSMFYNTPKLTDTSLNNVLKMCINATSYTGEKTLSKIGFNSSNYPSSKIQALPSYQDFITAGWTIGY